MPTTKGSGGRRPNMLIIGCDYHRSVQQIAWVDTETGECEGRRLTHSSGEAEQFYRELQKKGVSVGVGMEATGHSRWFERLLAESQLRTVGRRSGADSSQAGTEAKERPPGCRASSAADGGKSLSSHLGANARESR